MFKKRTERQACVASGRHDDLCQKSMRQRDLLPQVYKAASQLIKSRLITGSKEKGGQGLLGLLQRVSVAARAHYKRGVYTMTLHA